MAPLLFGAVQSFTRNNFQCIIILGMAVINTFFVLMCALYYLRVIKSFHCYTYQIKNTKKIKGFKNNPTYILEVAVFKFCSIENSSPHQYR